MFKDLWAKAHLAYLHWMCSYYHLYMLVFFFLPHFIFWRIRPLTFQTIPFPISMKKGLDLQRSTASTILWFCLLQVQVLLLFYHFVSVVWLLQSQLVTQESPLRGMKSELGIYRKRSFLAVISHSVLESSCQVAERNCCLCNHCRVIVKYQYLYTQ